MEPIKTALFSGELVLLFSQGRWHSNTWYRPQCINSFNKLWHCTEDVTGNVQLAESKLITIRVILWIILPTLQLNYFYLRTTRRLYSLHLKICFKKYSKKDCTICDICILMCYYCKTKTFRINVRTTLNRVLYYT